MKKYILPLFFSLISFVAFSQKGISYQAIILDPNPIEAPGLDIAGQPLVNGDVWMKFSIYNGSVLQFEEIHKTKTDAYGLVSLLIGSVSPTAFNSIVWDANQKNMQVFASFDQGASYTKVSEQKLVYTPYALFSETAGKLGGTLAITGGGTGATSLAEARVNLGIDKVDNTPDAVKPISAAVQAALDLKANKGDIPAATATITDADATTKGKIQLAGDLAGTAAAPTVPGLALKANTADVTSALTLKADTTYVVAKVAAATIADADASTKGKIQLAGDLGGTAAAPTVPGLALKANTADVTSALALKANAASLSTVATTGDYNDLSNKPTIPSAYSLPIASASVSGGIKVGANLSIDANGVLSAAGSSNASSLSGVVPVANGGTGTSTIAGIKTVLGLNSSSVAIGDQAGQNGQGANSVAIGSYAGQSSQVANSIAINATGSALNPTTTGFYVAPIRNASSSSSLFYNTTTKEITYGTASSSPPGVPYTGATGQVDLGAYNLTVNGLTVGKGVNSIGSNVAVGVSALAGTGNFNTAFGNNVLASSSQTGIYNNAFGFYSLNMNTTGRDNTAMGTTALYRNTTGESNSAFGNQALGNSVTGSNNTALGYQPLYLNTTGSDNTATGYQALKGNTIGSFNTAVGKFALNANVDGNYNTAIGNSADVASANLTNATAIGNGAIVSASNTIQLGNGSVTDVKTSGTLTAGAVTYPKVHGSANQVLSTTGSGTLTWTTPSSGSSNTHYIGESYGGGVVFYTWDNGAHGLIVSLTDQCCNSSTIGRFSAGTATNTLAYNGSGGALVNNQTTYTTITGGGVGAGKKNTLLIIASQGLGNGNKYAARYANEYSILSDGVLYDDWYLGSVDEYHLLANNYPQVLANNSFTPLNGPNKDYWTSTEINLTDAFTVYIRTNSTTSNIFNVFPNAKSMFNNGGYGNVRAIRSF